MKYLKNLLIAIFTFFSFNINASNIPATLKLNNGMKFEGIIKKINECDCQFKVDNHKYNIPLSDISDINVYNEKFREKVTNILGSQNNCINGQTDAELYHGKRGSHIALGFLTGVIGIVGVAIVANPNPYKGSNTGALSQNKNDFNDPIYLNCYKKKAKGKLVGSTAIGLAGWVALLLLVSSASY